MLRSRGWKRIRKMNSQDTGTHQQIMKIRRTTLGFGVVQILLGISLTSLSFTAFAFTSSDRIRKACPYWAGFTVFCSGGVGLIAWKNSTVVSMCLFTFFSAVCVVLQMVGTLLTGDAGGLLKSLLMCEKLISADVCKCCDSIQACQHSPGGIEFEGVDDCTLLTGLLTGLMYGLFVLTIFGSVLCFVATILGCTAVARGTGRNQGLRGRHSSRRSGSSDEDRYTWVSYPTDLSTIPSYAPPVYHSIENFPDYGLSSCIVPPPVFDPTDLPPPYSSQNLSLAESQNSLSSPESSTSQNQISIGQEVSELHTLLQSPPIYDNGPRTQSNGCKAPCGTSNGVIHLVAGDPRLDREVVGESCESFAFTKTDCSDQENPLGGDKGLLGRGTIGDDMKGIDVIDERRGNSSPRLERHLCEIVPQNARTRSSTTRTSGDESQVTEASGNRGTPTFNSPCQKSRKLSLTRCSKLGENSIYVNSFEVLSRPPPNVRVPLEDSQLCFTTNRYLNTRSAEQRLKRSFVEKHRRSQKRIGRGRRRRHGVEVLDQKRKPDAVLQLPASQVDCANEDSAFTGKESVV